MTCTCGSGDHPSVISHADGCPLADKDATVLVFRNGVGQPVAVPEQVVTEAERPYRAYQAHIGGTSWAQIAKDEGYADAAAARYDVQRYVEEGKQLVTMNSRRDQLQLEVARLDHLQSLLWAQANQGHLPAIKEAVNIIMSRSKLLSLAEMTEAEGGDERPTTVIIPGGDEYEAELRRHAGS